MIIVIARSISPGPMADAFPLESSLLQKWQQLPATLQSSNNYCPIMKLGVFGTGIIRDQLIGDIWMNRNPRIDKLFQRVTALFDRNQRLITTFSPHWIAVFTPEIMTSASFCTFVFTRRSLTGWCALTPRRISGWKTPSRWYPIESRSS